MENQPKEFDGNNKNYVSFLRQVEATVAALQFKTGTGKKKRIIDVLGVLLLGVHIKTIPPQDSGYNDVNINTLISSTEQAGERIPERIKSVLRATFQNLNDEEVFYSAQKEVLNAILKLISPKLPEVLTFQINDIFVASRLIWKLHRKFLSYVQKNIASINDDILNHLKKFKQLSHSKSDLAAYFAELHQLFSMSSSSTQGRFEESFLVKQVLNEVTKDERVPLMILAARLQEKSDCSLEDLEAQISEKIADQQPTTAVSPPQTERVPSTAFYAYPRRKVMQNRQTAFALTEKPTHFGNKDAKQSNIAKVITMPTLKSKNASPFVQKLDPCIWNAWPSAKQEKFSRLVREFKFKAMQMIRDEEEDDPVINEQVDLAAYAGDPGAFGFGSNAF